MVDIDTRISLHGGDLTVQRSQDCTAIAEYAKDRQREGNHGTNEMKLAASIPYVMVEKYINDNGITFAEFMANQDHIKRVCNDPAMSHFRIWPGRV